MFSKNIAKTLKNTFSIALPVMALIITILSTTSPLVLGARFTEISSATTAFSPGICPGGSAPIGDGSGVNSLTLQFKADFVNGKWSGPMTISAVFFSGQTLTKQGTISDVKFMDFGFHVTGTETSDNMCNAPVPTTFTIVGTCNVSEQPTFSAANGEGPTLFGSGGSTTCVPIGR